MVIRVLDIVLFSFLAFSLIFSRIYEGIEIEIILLFMSSKLIVNKIDANILKTIRHN